jgi:AcrR family transcriptional regulator
MGRTARSANETRRDQILREALRLFRERGFEGTPISAIANAVGMSKPGILHYFPAKDDMLKALFYPSFDEVESLLDRAPNRRYLIEEYLDIMLVNRELTALLATDFSVLIRPEIGERVEEINRRLQEVVAGAGADLTERIRAECALGALRSAVVAFLGSDTEIVRTVALEAAAAVLGFREQ